MKKVIELPFSKVMNPATYSQIEKLRSFEKFSYNVSQSQLMKRLDMSEAHEAIEELENGNEVEIKG